MALSRALVADFHQPGGLAALEFIDLSNQLSLLIASGGGEDIGLDPAALPASARLADHEIWFSSTSATNIGRHGQAAALAEFARLTGRAGPATPLNLWFNRIRERIAARLGGGAGDRVLLAPSATEARALARFVARTLLGGPLVEIAAVDGTDDELAAPDAETFLAIPLRDPDGTPRARSDIDAEALFIADGALEGGRSVLAHALDTSQTGLAGVSRSAARRIRRDDPARVLALVDASQLRLSPRAIADDLASEMMVIVTGSSFAAGPAHCAALLLPARVAAALEARPAVFDPDIAPARQDIPARLRGAFGGGFGALANLGLGLRWCAALAELDRYFATSEMNRLDILDAFSRKARARAARTDFVDAEPRHIDDHDPLRASIVPLTPRGSDGRAGWARAAEIRTALALPLPGSPGDVICHIGAPVGLGPRAALPLAASASMVSDVVARMALGISFDRAMAPVVRDIDTLLAKWEMLAG